MADCRYCGVPNDDDDSREWYICESCRAERNKGAAGAYNPKRIIVSKDMLMGEGSK